MTVIDSALLESIIERLASEFDPEQIWLFGSR